MLLRLPAKSVNYPFVMAGLDPAIQEQHEPNSVHWTLDGRVNCIAR